MDRNNHKNIDLLKLLGRHLLYVNGIMIETFPGISIIAIPSFVTIERTAEEYAESDGE